jgi:hypothetical protein
MGEKWAVAEKRRQQSFARFIGGEIAHESGKLRLGNLCGSFVPARKTDIRGRHIGREREIFVSVGRG